MTPYEILLMLDPELPEERQSEIVTRTRELIERDGGGIESHDVWGRRKLAYEISHKGEGVYHLLTFTAEPATLDEVSRILRITDGVMRHMPVRRSLRRTPAAGSGNDRPVEYATNTRSEAGDAPVEAGASATEDAPEVSATHREGEDG